jgi:hypothetical protein
MSKWHGGKGSKVRPTDKNKYDDNYDRIFGKKKGSEVSNPKKQKFTFKHWKSGDIIEIVGEEIPRYNHPSSDRLIVIEHETNKMHDIIKNTLVKVEEV